ncbi:MAG: hypothetical protein J6Q61_02775 [Bacteroidales bacterium]|nr:hypothetical protein [Bacteroidales bacterium]MBO5853641.1 hypothetical protein [Bacteroidales bacterium]
MFDISKFTSVAAQALSDNAEMHWLYQTTDSAATIQLAAANHFNNYFADAHSLLSEGNIITVRHMSTPDDTAATLSMTSTVIDEVDYIVIHKGEHRDNNARIVKDIFVYPLQKGQRILLRKFDDASSFTNTNVSFQSNVCASKLGIVRLATVGADVTLALKQHDNGGTQIGTVTMTAANSADANYFNEVALANSSQCIETTFNIAGNHDVAAGVNPFLMYIVAESDASAHVDTLALTATVADANANHNEDFVAPVSGRIASIRAVTSAAVANDTTFTASIDGTPVTGGVATIENGETSAVAYPTALNVVTAGQTIRIASIADGAAGSHAYIAVLLEA